ncbi:MAG: GAF domain-containing protein [Deltaproteobacteria bacterium]|nr:GAF domain-containing protein [Deltaproteobacteria bacterium]
MERSKESPDKTMDDRHERPADPTGPVVPSGCDDDRAELRRAAAERDRLAQQRQLALDAARMGWWHYDPETRIATYDKRYTEIFGVAGHEQRNDDILKLLHPDDLPRVWAAVEAALDPVAPTPYSIQYRVNRPDGSMRWVEAHGVAVFEGQGAARRATSFVGTVTDITERKQVERLYAVLSLVNEAIVRIHDQNALFAQVCRIVSQEGQFPLVWIGLVDGDEIRPLARCGTAAGYLDSIRVKTHGELGMGPTGTCIREGRSVINDDFLVNPATLAWRAPALSHGLRASAAFPLRSDGRPIGALTLYAAGPGVFDAPLVRLLDSLAADLSYALDAMAQEGLRAEAERALRESERSLRELDRRKNDFLAVLSHELRNPLAPIQNSLYILERAAPGSEQARRAHDIIRRQAAQLTRLVDDLLDLTRISRNKIQLQRRSLELNALFRSVVDDHRSLFDTAGVRIELKPAPQPIAVNADGSRLAQVLGNLLNNAAKFTPRGGRVTVSITAEPQCDRAVIRVTDTGVGLAPEMLARLFQPFAQADTSLDRSKGGLGLGLALVKGVVELHGGTIEVRSDGLGKGAEFAVRLPLLPAGAVAAAPPAPDRPRVPRRILVVEDNIDAADTLRELLELRGHRVEVAYDGPDGLARAREFRPEVVLCDIGLPGMDGYEVARAFHADDVLRDIRMVALSGYALPGDLQRAAQAGFAHHLAKPPSLEKLEELLAGPAPTAPGTRDGRGPSS